VQITELSIRPMEQRDLGMVLDWAAADLAKRHGMKPIFDTARMYRGAPPATDLTRTFGVTTLELG
jgi:hypothetical protein